MRTILGTPGATDYLSIQHDIVQQSVTNLTSYYYSLIKAKGWKGVTAGECLNDPQTNWYRTPGAVPVTTVRPISTKTISRTTTTSKTSTSVAVPPASPTCVVKAGKFCGTIEAFGDKKGCQTSAANCFQQSANCLSQAGRRNQAACNTYKADCAKLTAYCSHCGFTCSSLAFGKSQKRGH